MTQLRACPFCGENPQIVRGTRSSLKEMCFIECDSCNAAGEKFEDKVFEFAKEKAISAWNTRWRLIDEMFF